MASALSHAIVAVALGSVFDMSPSACALGAALAVLPDIDVLGTHLGIENGGLMGHRGLTHSPIFAILVVSGLILCGAKRYFGGLSPGRLWLYLVLAMASHGVVDAFTNQGIGVALLAPLSDARYFFPLRPIRVSPIIATTPFTYEAIKVTLSEFLWIWVPSIAIIFAAHIWRGGYSDGREA